MWVGTVAATSAARKWMHYLTEVAMSFLRKDKVLVCRPCLVAFGVLLSVEKLYLLKTLSTIFVCCASSNCCCHLGPFCKAVCCALALGLLVTIQAKANRRHLRHSQSVGGREGVGGCLPADRRTARLGAGKDGQQIETFGATRDDQTSAWLMHMRSLSDACLCGFLGQYGHSRISGTQFFRHILALPSVFQHSIKHTWLLCL